MKQMIMIYMLLCGILELTAKDFYHLPVVGNVSKQQVKCLHFSHDDSSPIWDLSKLQTEKNNYLISYEYNPVDDKILIGTEHNTRYYYQCCSDSVLLWGYENPTSKVEYDIPELTYKENFGLETSMDGVFHGLEFYGGRLSFRLFGTYRLKAKRNGTIVLPSGDSLHNVTMIHYAKTICKEKYSKVKSLEKLRNIVFSSHPYNVDSIMAKMKSDGNQILMHQYKWYAEGYRYPIYETITTGTTSCPNLYELAFYCSPEEQAREYDVANEKVRAQSSFNMGYANNTEISQEASKAAITISGKMNTEGTLSVCFDAAKAVYADVMVYTANGMLVTVKRNVMLSAEKQYYTFDVSKYNSDVYVITCVVDGIKTSTKINK